MSTAGCIRCQDVPSDSVARGDRMLRPKQRSRAQRGQEQHPPDHRLTHSAWLEHCSLPVWMPGFRCATCTRPPHTLTRERRCAMTGPAAAWTGTRPTSSPPTSQACTVKAHCPGDAPPDSGSHPPGGAARSRRCLLPPSCLPPSCGDAPRPQREREPPLSSATPPSDDRSHKRPQRVAMVLCRQSAGPGPGMPGVPARPPG